MLTAKMLHNEKDHHDLELLDPHPPSAPKALGPLYLDLGTTAPIT